MVAKHTPGPRYRDAASGLRCDVRAHSGRKVALCWGLSATKAATRNADAYKAECDANAHLIAAAPDLHSVCNNFEITGPDSDGFLWLVLHGKGTSGRATVNLGTPDRIVGQVALLLEEDRRAALAKASGEV